MFKKLDRNYDPKLIAEAMDEVDANNDGYIDSEMEAGIEVEKEHVKTYIKLQQYYDKHGEFPPVEYYLDLITKDHLDELKDYYTRLKKMEEGA